MSTVNPYSTSNNINTGAKVVLKNNRRNDQTGGKFYFKHMLPK